MTQYEKSFTAPVAFPPDSIERPLGRILSDAGKTQLRLAETYKYAHVTYFFNGLREQPYENELRALIPSLQTPHPEKQPKLRASLITDRLVAALSDRAFDFVLVNYANADTIGHTGNYDAGIEAVKALDVELGRILQVALNPHTILMITADHGNLEKMRDVFTWRAENLHNPSPVPFYLVGEEFRGKRFLNADRLTFETSGVLADIAPTILELMHLPVPSDMTGRSLLQDLV
jgi:2,3-bisphosphoglycerate-independent phosphoglycerate mutase